MDKNVSIVKVDKRPHRIIAQENWGLTHEQMKGKHVHHRIRRSDGGTNDPSNLYVCSPWFHDVIWHGGSGGFIELAVEGSKKAHLKKNDAGKSELAVRMGKRGGASNASNKTGFCGRTPEKMTQDGIKAGKAGGRSNAINKTGFCGRSPEKMSEDGRKAAKKLHEAKDERGKSLQGIILGKKGGVTTSRQKWIDPKHPELGVRTAGVLVRMQKSRGYPHGKENRVRIG